MDLVQLISKVKYIVPEQTRYPDDDSSDAPDVSGVKKNLQYLRNLQTSVAANNLIKCGRDRQRY